MIILLNALLIALFILIVAGLARWARRDRFATHVPPRYFD